MKRILIISANRTGHGHASIARAVYEQLSLYEDVETEIIDGFSLIGRLAVEISGLYDPFVCYAPKAWKVSFDRTARNPGWVTDILTPLLRKRLARKLESSPPGLILSVHPFFNSSILNNLTACGEKIPFAIMLADLADIHPLWIDKRADITFCPGTDALYACLSYGLPRHKLHLCSFPTRLAFTEAARAKEKEPYDGNRPLRCLLMAGGSGAGDLSCTAEILLRHFNVRLTILCGRNERLRRSLKETLFGKRVSLLGFREDVQRFMMNADVALMRASPNSMMEAVVCGTPLILTGKLPGQEERNPEFAQMRGLGVSCPDVKRLPPLLKGLLANQAEGLRHISEKQRATRNLDAAKEIAAVLVQRTLSTPPA